MFALQYRQDRRDLLPLAVAGFGPGDLPSANLVNGLLTIDLVREIPEAMWPRQIRIGGHAAQPEQIEQKVA